MNNVCKISQKIEKGLPFKNYLVNLQSHSRNKKGGIAQLVRASDS